MHQAWNKVYRYAIVGARIKVHYEIRIKIHKEAPEHGLIQFHRDHGYLMESGLGIIDCAGKRGISKKNLRARILGNDNKSYKKGHKHITLFMDTENGGVDFISMERNKSSQDHYYESPGKEYLTRISAVLMDMLVRTFPPILNKGLTHMERSSLTSSMSCDL